MRRYRSRAALLGVALLAVAFGAAPRANAVVIPKQLNCNNEYGSGTFSSVLVQSGNECDLYGVTVTGNVVVKPGGFLYVGSGSGIGGNLTNNGDLTVCNDTIGKSVFISGSGATYIGVLNSCDGANVGGNIQVQNDSGFVEVVYNSIGGSLHMFGNSGTLHFYYTTVGKTVSFESNSGPGDIWGIDTTDLSFLGNSGAIDLGNVLASNNALCRNNPNSSITEIGAGNRNTCT